MKKVVVGGVVCILIVGVMVGGMIFPIVIAAAAAAFSAWQIKTMQEKAKENEYLFPQCVKNAKTVEDGYEKAELLLKKIKEKSIPEVWKDLDARFTCINTLHTNNRLGEARAFVETFPLWLPKTNVLLVSLEKETKNDLAVLEGITKLSEKIEYFENEIVRLSSSIQEHIMAMEKTRPSFSETEAEQLTSVTQKLNELKKNLLETREINHVAIFMQLKSLSGTMERLLAKHCTTPSKDNILPFKVGRTLA